MNSAHDTPQLSPRAQALGLRTEDTYFDHDTGMREPKIAGTEENWENGTLGADERYARPVSLEEEKALGMMVR